MSIKSVSRFLGIVLIAFASLTYFWVHTHAAEKDDGIAILLNLKGAIGPAVADYISRGVEQAAEEDAKLVIIQMDTPGGLAKSMREIIQSILNSKIPVVTYVAPSGAQAASAGTYILYASHIAAMSPGTNLGAATPVAIGFSDSKPENKDGKEKGKKQLSTMEMKVTNDAVAYIRSFAELRGRNADWAEKAVKEAASLSSQAALKENVIDLIANSIPELLKNIHGREVKIGETVKKLATKNILVKLIAPDWRSRFLTVITDPSIAYILMLFGIYGLFLEFTNPGIILPGVAGAICILISLYAFQLLPINYVGLALMLLGIAFMVAEAFVTSFGVLGIGGVIAFIVGSILLMDTQVPGYTIALPLIVSVGIVTGAFVIVIMNLALKARRRPVVSGREDVIGSEAEVLGVSDGVYRVRVHGEIWQAKSDADLEVGQTVCVTELNGLLLKVEAKE